MTTLLFNVRPTEPAVYGAVSFVWIALALLASIYRPDARPGSIHWWPYGMSEALVSWLMLRRVR